MSSLQSLMELVTDLVSRIQAGTLSEGFHSPLQRGSAHGSVTVLRDEEMDGQLLLVVRLSIMHAPRENLQQFLATLLEINHRLHGRAAFSLDDLGTVYLTAGRPVTDLDAGEVIDLVLWTSEQADHYDDLLQEAFPG